MRAIFRPGMDWSPSLVEGERIIRHGLAEDRRGLGGGNTGPVYLTDRRLIWRQGPITWPLRRSQLNLRLADIDSVGKTTVFSYIAGGHRLELRMKTGKTHRIWVNGLDQWIEDVRHAVDNARLAEAAG